MAASRKRTLDEVVAMATTHHQPSTKKAKAKLPITTEGLYGPIGTIQRVLGEGYRRKRLDYFGEVMAYEQRRGKWRCILRLFNIRYATQDVKGEGVEIYVIGVGEDTGKVFEVLPSGRVAGIGESYEHRKYYMGGVWTGIPEYHSTLD